MGDDDDRALHWYEGLGGFGFEGATFGGTNVQECEGGLYRSRRDGLVLIACGARERKQE